jgi:YVTN family beta-propeller protein
MKLHHLIASAAVACVAAAPTVAQRQNSPVAVDPNNSSRVWVCNRDNNTVSVVNTSTGTVVSEIAVGVNPRSLAFNATGTKVYVANQRGNVPLSVHFATPFTGTEIRGTLSVIDVGTLAVTATLTNPGTEPYGVAFAPNGKYYAVTGFRSGTLKVYSAANDALLFTHQYDINLGFIGAGKTIADVDTNKDFIADLSEPRDFAISSNSGRVFVSHNLSPYISVMDVALDGGGNPTGLTFNKKIDTNTYAFDTFFNPTPVQTIASQGVPRFLGGIALSPDGTRLAVPHLLHNINHDVNHNFGPGLAGDFANRVYPVVSLVDATNLSFNQGGDTSTRFHNELSAPLNPAQYVPFGDKGAATTLGYAAFSGNGSPVPGTNASFTMTGGKPGDIGYLWYGAELNIPLPGMGTLLVNPTVLLFFGVADGSGKYSKTVGIPNDPGLNGQVLPMQAAVVELPSASAKLANGLRVAFGAEGYGANKLGMRAGHPQQIVYSPDGTRALLLNRGSEDVFLYDVTGSNWSLRTVYPPRLNFAARTPLDTTTPLGDQPLGFTVAADAATNNNDALVHVINEGTRTLSRLRVDWTTGVITKEGAQVATVLGPDVKSLSQRVGQELFEDASRPQTAGNFNNSCASCHFEGGADGNVWQRPAGPRSTMPVFGGTLGTGLILWKGVRLNMGETGPMFGGENGGNGVLSDAQQQGLVDYHEVIPVPLNPNLDPVTGALTAQAALGQDLFFGTNATGLNPTGRNAGCAVCHPKFDVLTQTVRSFTADFIDPPLLTQGENLEAYDPYCNPLKENIVGINIRNINSGANVDEDNDGFPELDRNFDGFNDLETYAIMNVDNDDDFTRDDANSYLCPDDPFGPPLPLKLFTRPPGKFSIPTKLGAFTSGPYFHDHVGSSLRALLDPSSQTTDPKYGNPTYPKMQKFFNEFHDIRGHNDFVPQASKVQTNLQSTNKDADIDAILAFIQSL